MVNHVLESLQFSITGSIPGLIPVLGDEPSERIEEQHARRQAAEIGGIDYIFFRRFEDGRSSQAAACVIDNADEHLRPLDLALIHQKLWLNGLSPLLYVGWETRVDVLSCARGPDFWKDSTIGYEPGRNNRADPSDIFMPMSGRPILSPPAGRRNVLGRPRERGIRRCQCSFASSSLFALSSRRTGIWRAKSIQFLDGFSC